MKPTHSRSFLIGLIGIVAMLIVAACAIPVAPAEQQSSPAQDTAEEARPEPTEVAAEEEVAEKAAAEPEPTEAAVEEPAAASNSGSEGGAVTFTIIPEQSEARYTIDEELRGNPVTVIGVSSSLNGQITIDPANPASTQIGTITIDAASFATDSGRRDGAVRRFVLSTNSYPSITFVPTAIEGLPDAAAAGDVLEFQVTGDLTIKDQTRSETFVVTVTADSEAQISGAASATIIYADYGIFIPDVPFVANVGDELKLEFDFVAAQ